MRTSIRASAPLTRPLALLLLVRKLPRVPSLVLQEQEKRAAREVEIRVKMRIWEYIERASAVDRVEDRAEQC
jgi:hypothetical protein